MTNATDNKAVATKYSTTYALRIVGNLGHANKLFDRTCQHCKGAYSSYIISTCPKCSAPLVYITTDGGKPMAISEGTIYLSQGPKTEERDKKAISNRKNGLTPLYRFKMFSFADENGVLGVPKDHQNMRAGAQIEVTIINHQAIPCGPFTTKKGGQTIEMMLLVYEDNGDTVKILRGAQAVEATTPTQVNAAGTIVPTNTEAINAELAALDIRIAALTKAAEAAKAAAKTSQVQDTIEIPIVITNDTTQIVAKLEIPDNTMQAVSEMEEPPFNPDESEADPFAAAS